MLMEKQEGDTLEEALENVQEAVTGYLEAMKILSLDKKNEHII